jgi:hypothetical protein
MFPDVDISRNANAHDYDGAQQQQDEKPFHGTQDNRAGRELTVTNAPPACYGQMGWFGGLTRLGKGQHAPDRYLGLADN